MLSNTPYRSFKAHTFEGGIASPLIVSWPAKLREHAGGLRHGLCHIIDILPTCLDAAGVEFPSVFRGRKPVLPDGGNLMDAVKGAELPQRPLFWEHGGSRSVYQDGWKLVADGVSKPWELYNLADDPTEQNQAVGTLQPGRRSHRAKRPFGEDSRTCRCTETLLGNLGAEEQRPSAEGQRRQLRCPKPYVFNRGKIG
jgi:arylsulfatase A-like enzyme